MQGDIIPGIVEVIDQSDDFNFPNKCPYCGSIIKEKGKFHYCVNPGCKARAVKSLSHFLKNLDIGFAGDTNLLNWKIFSISDLIAFEPFGKQQEKFVKELKTKLWEISEEHLIKSFDYSGIGKKIIQKIIDANSVNDFVNRFFKEQSITLKKCVGITDTTFKRIEDGVKFNDVANSYFSIVYNDKWHRNYNKQSIVSKPAEDSSLVGQSFCFTGALTIPRKMAETLVRQHGGEIKTAVNKTLTYLVTNDPTTKTTKNIKAMELGVNVISEKTFFSLVNYELPESLKIIASINDSMKKNKNKIVKDSIADL
jgi:DNA ligase (NAD+)